MVPRYLQYLLTDFRQTFVTGASRDRDELIRFWGQKVKVQGHAIAAEASLPSSATFSSSLCPLVVSLFCAVKFRRIKLNIYDELITKAVPVHFKHNINYRAYYSAVILIALTSAQKY